MRIRTTAAAVLVAAAGTLALGGVAHAQTDERDCQDFTSLRQAQAVLDSTAGDPERLDADRDGQACEVWFADRGPGGSSTGPARQVSPVPRGGVDTGLDIARPVRSKPAPPAILLVAAFAVAGTAAAGAAAAAREPARILTPARVPVMPTRVPTPARGRAGGAPGRPQPPVRPQPVRAQLGVRDPEAIPPTRVAA